MKKDKDSDHMEERKQDNLKIKLRFEQFLKDLYMNRSKLSKEMIQKYGMIEEPVLPIEEEELREMLPKETKIKHSTDQSYLIETPNYRQGRTNLTLHFPFVPSERKNAIFFIYDYLKEIGIPFSSKIDQELTNDNFTISLSNSRMEEAQALVDTYHQRYNLIADNQLSPIYPTIHGIGVSGSYLPFDYMDFMIEQLHYFYTFLDNQVEKKDLHSFCDRFSHFLKLQENNLKIDNSRVTEEQSYENPLYRTNVERMLHILSSSVDAIIEKKNPLKIYQEDFMLSPMEAYLEENQIKIYDRTNQKYIDPQTREYYDQINQLYNQCFSFAVDPEGEKESYDYLSNLISSVISFGDQVKLKSLTTIEDPFIFLLNVQEAGYIALFKMGLSLREVNAITAIMKSKYAFKKTSEVELPEENYVKEVTTISIPEPSPRILNELEVKEKLKNDLKDLDYLKLIDEQILARGEYILLNLSNLKDNDALTIEHILKTTIKGPATKQEYLEYWIPKDNKFFMNREGKRIPISQSYLTRICSSYLDEAATKGLVFCLSEFMQPIEKEPESGMKIEGGMQR